MYGSVLAGTAGFIIAETLGYPLIGVGVYWTGCLAFVGIWRGASVAIYDERDVALERRASFLTLNAVAVAGIIAWPAVLVLSETTTYTAPPEFSGALLGFAAMYGLFGVIYLTLRYRP